jgi:hypothetical protein
MSDATRSLSVPALAPLLVMGSPRSGTTFLAQMVNRFFDIHICRDNGTMLRFHRMLSSYRPLTDDANLARLIRHLYGDFYFRQRLIGRGFELRQEELLRRVQTRTYGGLIEAIFSATAQHHGKSTWGYKRASLARVEGHHIDELFPQAKFVHIIRDARDVVLSMRTSTDLLLERSWHFGAADWVSHVRTGQRIGRQLGPGRYFEVRYERYMADPAGVLTEILEFCGGEGDSGRRERIRAEIGGLVKSGNTEKWRRQVPPAALRTIERVAGPLLLELGYPVVNGDVSGRRIGGPEMAWLHLDRVARNLLHTRFGAMARYRFEVLKTHRRARFSTRHRTPGSA